MTNLHLEDDIAKHFRLVASQKKALAKLGIETVQDLLMHTPARYEDVGAARSIAEISSNETVTVYGELQNLEKSLSWKTKKYVVTANLVDTTGTIGIKWFNQSYAANMFEHARYVKVTGKATGKVSASRRMYFANPAVETMPSLPDLDLLSNPTAKRSGLIAIYPESKGITSRWFQIAIKRVIESGVLEALEDYVPEEIVKKYNLPSLETALVWAHIPEKMRDAHAARKRFAFDEVFAIQLAKQRSRHELKQKSALKVQVDKKAIKNFVSTFPYQLTSAQQKAVDDILHDFETGQPMSRLLEGDVGSGKTAVAAAAVYAVITSKPPNKKSGSLQTAYMVPTEILARQQFDSFIQFFTGDDIGCRSMQIGLITSSGCYKFPSKTDPNKPTKISRTQLLKWVENGEIPIVVGTHALIQKSVKFKDLGLVIIDEQHRFGTIQRKMLARKDEHVPHLLSMTATPIPRTLALAIYGDLDLTLLDEMPTGRKQVHTEVVKLTERDKVYEKIREELRTGKQSYVICPRVYEPDPTKATALRAKSAEAEMKKLQNEIFTEYAVGMLHGKMLPKEKDEVMKRFESGEIDILVATTVVEVGVNVPNATVIIIEGAERFGLAQLHQLRGRVRRSSHQPYCYLFSESKSENSVKRLKALEKSRDGFELAEKDLELRGAGELYGAKQWGLSDLGMEAIRNIKMVEAARKEAQTLITKDPKLDKYPALQKLVVSKSKTLHFE